MRLTKLEVKNLKYFRIMFTITFENIIFSNRVIQIWNGLPDSVVESKSINSFENNLDKFWQNEDVKFNWKANLTSAGSRSLSLM